MYFHILLPYTLPKQQQLLTAFKLLVLSQPFPCTFSPLVLGVAFMFQPFFVIKFPQYLLQINPLHISFPRNKMQMTVCSLCEVWVSGLQQAAEHNSEPKFYTHISFCAFHFQAGTVWPRSCLCARGLFRVSVPTSHLHMTPSHSSRQ